MPIDFPRFGIILVGCRSLYKVHIFYNSGIYSHAAHDKAHSVAHEPEQLLLHATAQPIHPCLQYATQPVQLP